jgi:hypothetical protein
MDIKKHYVRRAYLAVPDGVHDLESDAPVADDCHPLGTRQPGTQLLHTL